MNGTQSTEVTGTDSASKYSAAPWLVMIYLAGDTNLTEEMVLAMKDLVDEGPPKGDLIVAQFDPSGMGLSTQRYIFMHSENSPKDKTLEHYRDKTFDSTETNTGSP